MVRTVNDGDAKQNPPLVVELVGLAAAGKTTLARALSQRDGKILVAADLELRKREHIPIFVSNVPFLLPLFLRRCRSSRWFTWDEIKAMVYLRAWPRVVRRQASNDGTLILLDHGPVFKLAKLNAFGPEKLKSQGFEHWWHSMFEQWAFTLDIVIWLDAPDKILLERINARNKRHAVKGKSEREAYEFLIRYRTSYEQILAKLTAYGRPTLFPFDTSQASIEQTADEVLAACDLKRSERLSLASHDFTIR